MTRRRLLYVADSLDVGGAERVLVGLAGALAQRGHQIRIACSVGGALEAAAVRAGVEVRVLGRALVKRPLDRDYADAIAELIAAEGPELVHTHMFASTTAAALALEQTSVPLVVHEHSEVAWRGGSAGQEAAEAYRRSAAILAVSRSVRERLVHVDGVPANKVHLVPNSLLTGTFMVTGDEGGCGDPSPGQGPRVGFVGPLRPEKGGTIFMRAASRLIERVPDATFVVIGDGPERAAMEGLARDAGLPARFLGFRVDGPRLIANLDLLVVPSLSAGTPLVVLEAAAARVPIVASAVGGISEQVQAGIEALLVAPGDDAALADACWRVLVDPCLRESLVRAAYRRLTFRSCSMVIDALEGLYRNVIRTAALPAAI